MPHPAKRRMTFALVGSLLLLALLAPVVGAALLVDDWSRDLTTNAASTSPDAADPALRPVETDLSVDGVRDHLVPFRQKHGSWRLVDEQPLPDDSPIAALIEGTPEATLHLTHSTQLLGFVDDVWLVVERLGDSRLRLHGESRSRVGKGDLGQNPRNLHELMGAFR